MAKKAKKAKKAKTSKKSTKASKQTTQNSKHAKKRRYSKGAGKEVEKEMRRYKRGIAKSGRGGTGGKVKSRKQAIAIGLSKARKKGKKVPKKRSSKSG
jgi:hypothetical protein